MQDSMDANQPGQTRQTRQEVMQEIESARAALLEALRPLTPEQLTAPAPDGGWSVKDHLAHLGAWAEGISALLRREPRWRVMGIEEAVENHATEDEVNAILHMRCRDCSLETVQADFERIHQGLLDALNNLTDSELYQPYSYFQSEEMGLDNGHPIVDWVRGNSSEHYLEHVGWIRKRFAA